VGGLIGGFVSDRFGRDRTIITSLLLSVPFGLYLALVPSAGWDFALAAIASPERWVFIPCFSLAIFFLFLNTGLLNAVIVSVSPPPLRATAVAANIVIIHILGDAPSPFLIGAVSDATSLQGGILLAVIAMVISGVLLLWGARWLPGDLDKISGATPALVP